MMLNNSYVRNSIIGIKVTLYAWVSIISTIHVIDFFELTNPHWLAIGLAIAFELGAAASLASLIILDKTSKLLVWLLFIALTSIQILGNMYYAYNNAHDFTTLIELLGLVDEDLIFQKRILAIISGAILPMVALGFIKTLVDYIKPSTEAQIDTPEPTVIENKDNILADNIIKPEETEETVNKYNKEELVSIEPKAKIALRELY